MKKEEHIKKYGEAAYSRKLELARQWKKVNPEAEIRDQERKYVIE